MINLQNHYRQCTGEYFPIDIYGSGPEEEVIKRAFLGRNKKATEKTEKDQSRHRLNGQDEDENRYYPHVYVEPLICFAQKPVALASRPILICRNCMLVDLVT